MERVTPPTLAAASTDGQESVTSMHKTLGPAVGGWGGASDFAFDFGLFTL